MKVETKEIDGETWVKFNSEFDKFRYYQGNFISIILIVVLIVMGLSLGYLILNYIDLIQSNPCRLCEEGLIKIIFSKI